MLLSFVSIRQIGHINPAHFSFNSLRDMVSVNILSMFTKYLKMCDISYKEGLWYNPSS